MRKLYNDCNFLSLVHIFGDRDIGTGGGREKKEDVGKKSGRGLKRVQTNS